MGHLLVGSWGDFPTMFRACGLGEAGDPSFSQLRKEIMSFYTETEVT